MHLPPHTVATVLLLTLPTSQLLGAPLPLAQVPAGSSMLEPAPNVILSVDNSESMRWNVDNDGVAINPANSRLALLQSVLRSTFGDPFQQPPSKGKLADGSIRLAWQALNDTSKGRRNDHKLINGEENSMRSFEGEHRRNFGYFVRNLTPARQTPSHRMMINAYRYMRQPEGLHSPWADRPGTAQTTPYLDCRRTYHVFMTDGAWDAVKHGAERAADVPGDSMDTVLGDGSTAYQAGAAQSRIYADPYYNTLSDFAFQAWAEDLQDGSKKANLKEDTNSDPYKSRKHTAAMGNNVRPLIRQHGSENFVHPACPGTTGTLHPGMLASGDLCGTLDEFWNPRNDPATWQHITLFTVGFGASAIEWDRGDRQLPRWDPTTDDTFGGEFPLLLSGQKSWGNVFGRLENRPSELWHMAINGRGRFFPARTAQSLDAAFSDIFDTVLQDSGKPLLSTATNTGDLRASRYLYTAGYHTSRFTGWLRAQEIDSASDAVKPQVRWDAAALLDARDPGTRFIFSAERDRGVSWRQFNDLPDRQRQRLSIGANGAPDQFAYDRWRHVRGYQGKELARGGRLRDRSSRLGDIVNSRLWYTGTPNDAHSGADYASFRQPEPRGVGDRPHMLYVGANDGMLHGFIAADWTDAISRRTFAGGTETMAFIPQGIAENQLHHLSNPGYRHRYFVDGSPFTGDAKVGQPGTWATVLVGSLGAGGKGYFVLDVSKPVHMREVPISDLVHVDATARPDDPDLGHIISPPATDSHNAARSSQIVQMNNQRWAVLLGNGYNSQNEAPVLLVQFLDGAKEVVPLSPCRQPIASFHCNFKGGNGLSTPRPVDMDGDGRMDVAYAGDLRGNLWKFDLASADPMAWKTAFGSQPFFVAARMDGSTQPITTAPLALHPPEGGTMLLFGTGRNLTAGDATSTEVHSIYALHDSSTHEHRDGKRGIQDGPPINAPGARGMPATLVQHHIAAQAQNFDDWNFYALTEGDAGRSGSAAQRGWYLHLPLAGQRVLDNISALAGGSVLIRSTIVRSGGNGATSRNESCTPEIVEARNFITVLNAFSGRAPARAPFGSTAPTLAVRTDARSFTTMETKSEVTSTFGNGQGEMVLDTTCGVNGAPGCDTQQIIGNTLPAVRTDWRQIQ